MLLQCAKRQMYISQFMFTYCTLSYVEVITKSLILKIFSFVNLVSKKTGGEHKGCTVPL